MWRQIWVNIGLGNGLLPDGTKPLLEPMMTYQLNQCWLIISEVLWHSPENNISILDMSLKIIDFRLQPHLPWVNELSKFFQQYMFSDNTVVMTASPGQVATVLLGGTVSRVPSSISLRPPSRVGSASLVTTALQAVRRWWSVTQENIVESLSCLLRVVTAVLGISVHYRQIQPCQLMESQVCGLVMSYRWVSARNT